MWPYLLPHLAFHAMQNVVLSRRRCVCVHGVDDVAVATRV
jgi:hypothetical protein